MNFQVVLLGMAPAWLLSRNSFSTEIWVPAELERRREGKREAGLERDLWKSEERPTGEEEERRQEGVGWIGWGVQKISKE